MDACAAIGAPEVPDDPPATVPPQTQITATAYSIEVGQRLRCEWREGEHRDCEVIERRTAEEYAAFGRAIDRMDLVYAQRKASNVTALMVQGHANGLLIFAEVGVRRRFI